MGGWLSTLLQLLSNHHEASPADSDEASLTASDHESSHQQEVAEDNKAPGQKEFEPTFMDTDRQEHIPASNAEAVKGTV